MLLCTHPAAELGWGESGGEGQARRKVDGEGPDHGYLVPEKQEGPQGGLQSQYRGAQAMSCGVFSMQCCLNQCTLKEAEQTNGSAKSGSPSTRHPVSCTMVYRHAGPDSGGGSKASGPWGGQRVSPAWSRAQGPCRAATFWLQS